MTVARPTWRPALLATLLLAGPFTGPALDQDVSRAAMLAAPVYDLLVQLRPDSGRLALSGTVTLPASPHVRDHVELSLSELMQDLKVAVLRPLASAGSATLEPRLRPSPRPGWGTVTWTIRPPHPIPAGAAVVLRLQYRGGRAQTSEIFSVSRQCAFGAGIKTAWYPELEDGSLPPNGELRGVRGTGRVEFVVPPRFVVYAPGVPSGEVSEERAGRYRFAFSKPIYFSFAAARYTVVHRPGAVAASVYLLRPREGMASYLDQAARVLEVLSHEFGSYPQPQFAIAEVPAGQADSAGFEGASLEGLVLASTPYLEKPFNTAYFGHELSHQWWPNLVASMMVTGARMMLSEGLAQYGSLRAVEELEGDTAAERYRRLGYPGFSDGAVAYGAVWYLRLAAAGEDGILSDLPTDVSRQRALVLTKGFLVWDMLSRTVGRERFRAAMHEITSAYAYRRITWEEFLAVVQRHAARDLRPFVSQWFDRPGAPEFRLAWRSQPDGMLRITVTQASPAYTAQLEIETQGTGDRRSTRDVAVSGERTELPWRVGFPVERVVLDPHFRVLRWAEGDRADATSLVSYTRVGMMLDAGRTADAEENVRRALVAPDSGGQAGVLFLLHYAYAQLLISRGDHLQALREVRAALAAPVRRADALPLVFGLLAQLAYATKDSALLRAAADSAVVADAAIGGQTGAGDDARRLVRMARRAAAHQP